MFSLKPCSANEAKTHTHCLKIISFIDVFMFAHFFLLVVSPSGRYSGLRSSAIDRAFLIMDRLEETKITVQYNESKNLDP